jgi:mRNA-degrading endonuclease toxin of MazEF toxin-antitoxin module
MPRIVLKVKKGDIFVVDNSGADGHVQKGVRPHVVVTQVTGGTVTVAPCTSTTKPRPYAVKIQPDAGNHLKKTSFVLIAQAFAADTSFLTTKIGTLTESDVMRIQLEYVKYVTD